MRRPILVLAALAALLALPGIAAAGPPGPEPSAPALVRAPYLLRGGDGHATLYVRLSRPIARRFDGELLATAIVDGRFSSLSAVRGRGRRTACYSASVTLPRTELGRLSTAVVAVNGAEPVTALVALRGPRPGDTRGAPLRC
jgi:hypothetical protein